MSQTTLWLARILLAGAAAAQCTFSPLEPGPSALATAAPRKVFPISTPAGDTQYIDKTGKIVPAPKEPGDALSLFKEFVDGHPRYGFRDASGAVKIAPRFLDALPFAGGLAGVKDANGKWGFVDASGALRIAAQFQAVDNFSGGRAAVDLCDRCGYIDSQGKPAFAPSFRHCYRFQDHIAKVEFSQGLWGFIDESGKTLAKLSGNGEFALFSEGLMPAEKDGGGVGFVDATGKFAIQPRFAFVEPFSEGLAAVKADKTWGYIDKTGKFVIDPSFCDPADPRGGYFHEGLAFVCDAKTHTYGFIDRAGKYVIPPQFGKCNDASGQHCAFDGGLAWVETKTREGYIDPHARFIWSRPVGKGR